jgi:uncharacterized protein
LAVAAASRRRAFLHWHLHWPFDITTDRSYTVSVRFEWDEAKRRANIRKHGIDFIGIETVFAGETVTIRDDRYDYPETRFISLGAFHGRVVVIAPTETDEAIRIISIRRATRNEEISYFKEIAR